MKYFNLKFLKSWSVICTLLSFASLFSFTLHGFVFAVKIETQDMNCFILYITVALFDPVDSITKLFCLFKGWPDCEQESYSSEVLSIFSYFVSQREHVVLIRI